MIPVLGIVMVHQVLCQLSLHMLGDVLRARMEHLVDLCHQVAQTLSMRLSASFGPMSCLGSSKLKALQTNCLYT